MVRKSTSAEHMSSITWWTSSLCSPRPTITPDAFKAYGAIARAKGFLLVAASPLTRSSYHAGDDFEKMRAAREAKLAG